MPRPQISPEMRTMQRREIVASALREYLEALRVIEWLKDNHLVGADKNASALAYQYAIRFTSENQVLNEILEKTAT